jgi:hypothetical protein
MEHIGENLLFTGWLRTAGGSRAGVNNTIHIEVQIIHFGVVLFC